ncbi:uncharacterized protein [Anoplolepis gracilipes]|uniref:uncharacterized protein n=1 Tax=Anoplolepis gracilipes TaxID=354296 RepID=UPI003BA3DF97
MDSETKPYGSLPPLVEGKVHGNLRLVIDEVLWLRSPGDVTVVASWWGEHDSAQFRPVDSITNTTRTDEDTTKIYAIKTNTTLFEDYLKNCGTVELVIIAEKSREIIGTAHVGDLSKIFTFKYYTQLVPILSNNGDRIGKIRVSLQLTYLTKFSNMQLKTCKYNKKQEKSDVLASVVDNLQYNEEIPLTFYKNADVKKKDFTHSTNNDTCDVYRSVLKAKRLDFQESKKKLNEMVTDKLVAQIVARAQRLRGAILKETYNDDSLALSDNSMSNDLCPYASAENEAKLYEYILGTEMTSSEEKKALNTLRSTSPTPSLIDLASETITANKKDSISIKKKENSLVKSNSPVEDTVYEETIEDKMKGTHPLDYVDSIRIFIESFTLSPAGYRRAKSTCLQHGIPLSLTYFIQYDTTFGSARQTNIKSNKEIKFVRTCAKKQVGQVIDFNSEGIYSIQRHIIKKNFSLKFKIFVRHLNQKFPTELGFGSMNINDITNTVNLSSTQRVVIINKGIKIGDLKVTVELGCDFTYFGKEFVDAVMSAKENIPVLEMESLNSSSSNKYKNATGTHSSKPSSKVSSVSAKRIECLTSNNNKDLIATRDIAEHRERSSDNKKIDTSNPENGTKDKVLLHGLIYVAEGKNLPESNTYLICRAFWREDKATSQICSNTKNPFYHFFQLVPLIHGIELLERIRDNYIIIEVYSRQNSETDNLLGIAKLPVHQLYIAYRDPLVLPHLLLSKYPVISVDGWVNINNPVSGESCGELLALVALGTAEQIALLEVSRGLRNTSVIPRTVYHCHVLDNTNNATNAYQENLPSNVPEVLNLSSRKVTRDNHFAYHVYNTTDRDSTCADYKSQESQTDISSLQDAKSEKPVEEIELPEQLALHALVDRLTNALHINKISTDQSAQTEMNQADEGEMNEKELRLNTLNSNSLTDNSDNSCSPRNDFQLPTEMYRSVGVGAEYDEELDRQRNNAYDNLSISSATKKNVEKEELNTDCDDSFFRAVVEIECALHLPKIKGPNEFVEPSTYVTFQDLTHKLDSNSQLNSYMITNVFPHNCNPQWNWKCDAKLPMDLLNNQKRLILKVWYLIDPDTSTEINLEKDIVIGFSAVDLSVLIAGFPTVSGWFHIMDFTGKCNGQIKITVTPLDNLSLEKFAPTDAVNPKCSNLSQTNWLHLYNTPCRDITESNSTHRMLSYASHDKDRYAQSNRKSNEFVAEMGHGLEDVSMSFLSLSLKQKLTELDEITKRLQTRLSDVTNTAFEDDFDNDFDMIEPNSDNENTDDKNGEITPQITSYENSANNTSQMPKQNNIQSDRNLVNDEGQTSAISSNYNSHFESGSDQVRAINSDATDTGYCTGSNTRFAQHPGYYHNQYQNRYGSTRNYLSSSSTEYPARGTKTHINHLLDKLSLDLPPRPPSAIPIKKDILELFASLREHRNNPQDKDKNNRGIDTCSVPTQTDDLSEPDAYFHPTNIVDGESFSKSSQISESQPRNRISTVIREELVAEENNDNSNCDELTTYLITSNVRHMDLDSIFNPLLYQHLLPDLQVTAAVSPEGEAEQLDNQYARSFGMAMMRDSRLDHSTENKTTISRNDVPTKSRTSILDSEENTGEFSTLTDSDVSGNVDSSIDVTVIYKSNNNDLMSDNSTESTIDSTSFAKSSTQQTDTKMENYCSTELSVPGVSRQAPEGGNPVEEAKIVSVMINRQNDIQDVSGDS